MSLDLRERRSMLACARQPWVLFLQRFHTVRASDHRLEVLIPHARVRDGKEVSACSASSPHLQKLVVRGRSNSCFTWLAKVCFVWECLSWSWKREMPCFFCRLFWGLKNHIYIYTYIHTYRVFPWKWTPFSYKQFCCFPKSSENEPHHENCFPKMNPFFLVSD